MKIILPKTNEEGKSTFSYSQYSKWKRSKKEYIRAYFFKEPFEGNAYTFFGTKVGEALEVNDFVYFEKPEIETLKKVTRLDEFERKITYDLGEIDVLGFIDTNSLFDSKVKIIIDYKTGDLGKASVYEDEDYIQIPIYAGAIEQETGVLPTQAWVELIERTGNPFRGEELKVGTSIVKIPQDVSKKNIERVKKNVLKTAKEISTYYQVFERLNSFTV
jgi:hypothetical protein